ncbi:MAG TPA: condensation domain-containing protein, partial [Candidatus Binatia bacterium]|nr:condensation domain-containing protein [Candidatus Binatia bacterium]
HFIEPAKTTRTQTASSVAATPETESEGEVKEVPIHHVQASVPTTREKVITETLRKLLSDLSGLNLATMTGTTSFAEMGLESLFLTQFSVAIEKKFGVRVAFRLLLEELSTLDALAEHVESCSSRGAEAHFPEVGSENRKTQNGQCPLASAATIPLTEAQRELWFASQMSDAASCCYNECRLLHLRGELKENTLVAAIQTLMQRHEALRITFAPDGNSQEIHPSLNVDVPLLDWSKLPADTHAPRLNILQLEEAQLPFDLTGGPLLRAWLIRLEEQHHVLVLTVHHIVCDGFSLGILLRELAEIYSAESQNIRPELPAPLQLGEYVQREIQQDAAGNADAEFWTKQFAGETPILELPTDRPRPATWTFEAARESRVLPATLGAELKRVGAQHGGTLFTTLLAAYGALLHRLSGQDEIVIGIPVADRATAGGETLVGHCVNFLPLRLSPGGDVTFAEFLRAVQKMFLNAHEHQHFTFGCLLQKLNLSRDTSRMPLVSVTFNVQRLGEELKFAGLETELAANVHSFTNFDLGFNVTETGGELQLDCRYNTGLFTRETIRRWLAHFQMLLEGITANPAQHLDELPLLTADERQQILVEWNSPATNQADQRDDKCLHQFFEEQVERTPDAVALVFETQNVTYRELNRRANCVARNLRSRGVGPDKTAAIMIERSVEMVIAVLAVLKAGGA